MPNYAQLDNAGKLRIDAHLADHFRDNDGGYANEFRRAVREVAHLHKESYNDAYNRVLTDLRDGLAERLDLLSPVRSENIGHDRQQLRTMLRFLGQSMTDELQANPLTESPGVNYTRMVNDFLTQVRHDPNSGSDLRIEGNRDSLPPLNYLRNRANDMLRINLITEYSSGVEQATRRLQTRLGDRLEAESLRVAINEFQNSNIVEDYLGDGHRQESRDAVVRSLRARGVSYREGDVDAIVNAALPLADGGHMPDRGGKGPQR
ncbi:MAG: hypothetical protein DI582_09335 [Azospirillum brasilense]|nr:MAG: hypothetical protein DI582_09335 [Azospirillum brasilense]